MSIEMAESIIDSTDFTALCFKLMQIIDIALSLDEYDNEVRQIVDYALEVWVGCLFHKNEIISDI